MRVAGLVVLLVFAACDHERDPSVCPPRPSDVPECEDPDTAFAANCGVSGPCTVCIWSFRDGPKIWKMLPECPPTTCEDEPPGLECPDSCFPTFFPSRCCPETRGGDCYECATDGPGTFLEWRTRRPACDRFLDAAAPDAAPDAAVDAMPDAAP